MEFKSFNIESTCTYLYRYQSITLCSSLTAVCSSQVDITEELSLVPHGLRLCQTKSCQPTLDLRLLKIENWVGQGQQSCLIFIVFFSSIINQPDLNLMKVGLGWVRLITERTLWQAKYQTITTQQKAYVSFGTKRVYSDDALICSQGYCLPGKVCTSIDSVLHKYTHDRWQSNILSPY